MKEAAERCPQVPTVPGPHWRAMAHERPHSELPGNRQGKGVRAARAFWALERRVSKLAIGFTALVLAGCGHAVFAMEIRSASMRLAEAREVGAPELAPYEYYYAEAHLEEAKQEAAEADYGDAIELASTSAEYAEKAIELSENAREGAHP